MTNRLRSTHFNEVNAFKAVAISGSFRGAAIELGLAPSTVSHSINSLERRLGVRLLHRTTRSVALTEEGRNLLSELAPLLASLEAAIARAGHTETKPAGMVRLAAPRLAVHSIVLPCIAHLAEHYPDVILDVRTVEQVGDLVAEGFDLGIQQGKDIGQDMIAIPLSEPFVTAIVGSPQYFARRPAPLHPRQLVDHICIGCRSGPNQSLFRWRFEKGEEQLTLDLSGPLVTDDAEVMLEGALQSVGLWHGIEYLVHNYLETGRLVRVLADWSPTSPGFHLCYTRGVALSAAARVVVDTLKKARKA